MQTLTLTGAGTAGVLERAVHISLFTWRRAEASDQVDGNDRQGWFGDSYPSYVNDRIGSRLWLLRRRTITAQTLRDAQRFCEEALQWLVDDGYVSRVTVTITRHGLLQLRCLIALERPDGDPISLNMDDLLKVGAYV